MKNNEKYICRICNTVDLNSTFYPDIYYNNKVFKYYKCKNCKSYNVFPSPNDKDLSMMYGDNDHKYLEQISGKIEYNFNYPFANHQAYQIKFLNQIKNNLKGKTLLDYGCGSGFYMEYAKRLDAKVTGIEIDEKFVRLLKNKTNHDIYSFENFKEVFKGRFFDYIHIGHVLEHLSNPKELIEELKVFANKNTIFLIDGPLERNRCISHFYINLGSRIKRKKQNEFAPQHLTLTNKKAQKLFFNNMGILQEKYVVVEQYFPLPNKISKNIFANISYVIASISILISKVISNSGNVFHFRGRIK